MEYQSKSIRKWAVEDRPRERLLQYGKNHLTNVELLAIILGSGSKNQSALSLARDILANCEGSLNGLSLLRANDLYRFKGVGPAKAINLIASLELGRRATNDVKKNDNQITTSRDAFYLMKNELESLEHEEFWIVLLKRNNGVIGKFKISSGGVAGTAVDLKLIFRHALDHLASSLIIYHNHPSGNLKPSQMDINLTNKINLGARQLDIKLLDHLIISHAGYLSLADEGLICED